MTPTSVRWTHVIFGVCVTAVIAMAPLAFVVFAGSADAGTSAAASANTGLLSGGFEFFDHQIVLISMAAAAVFALVAAVVLTTRAERSS